LFEKEIVFISNSSIILFAIHNLKIMKNLKIGYMFFLLAVFVLFQSCDSSKTVEKLDLKAIVSAEWLDQHMKHENLIIVDVRPKKEYDEGHIPGSISIPFVMPNSEWCRSTDKLLMEVPEVAKLEKMLGDAGISNNSQLVLITDVNKPSNPPFSLANPTRVAITLFYVGMTEVGILDGGMTNWKRKGKKVTTETTKLPSTTFVANINKSLFVDVDYVEASINHKILIDTRDSIVHVGDIIEPWADSFGHILNSKCLPAPIVWDENGMYKSQEELRKLVDLVLEDTPKDDPIITYCGVGGYSCTWQFLLIANFGYTDVKMYDPGVQEWVREHSMVSKYPICRNPFSINENQ